VDATGSIGDISGEDIDRSSPFDSCNDSVHDSAESFPRLNVVDASTGSIGDISAENIEDIDWRGWAVIDGSLMTWGRGVILMWRLNCVDGWTY
jgi:hypothetical protein